MTDDLEGFLGEEEEYAPRNTWEEDFLSVMNSKQGRRVLAGICEMTGMDSVDFCADLAKDSYNTGRRSIGVQITDEMKRIDYRKYVNMITEKKHG